MSQVYADTFCHEMHGDCTSSRIINCGSIMYNNNHGESVGIDTLFEGPEINISAM